ncbi:hypothetical protein [Pedobacter metabolipauper]|uniref:Uncharacterized protein n=1 Tax=Pedobacter metabolipauper TaxID=425513 RepID=A0A4R6SXY6_9SPHI|nr:hypothetical protein [Pedobacter metabolipauper]TDQ11394.1 hypothetical protein ATK78_0512 [Pedobacter metabolipauper]
MRYRSLKFSVLLLNFLFISVFGFSQSTVKKDLFNHLITRVKGDLNKDGIPDQATVFQDTVNDQSPYRLQVLFGKPGGDYQLVMTSLKAISPQYPGGKNGYVDGGGFRSLEIKSNVLTINVDLLRGGFCNKFRYQNGNFELIGYTGGFSDGQGSMYHTDYNLSTGLLLETKENYETGKMLSNTRKIVKVRPLPKLRDFEPESEVYH